MTHTEAPCARCGNALPPNWFWVKDADGKLTGQAVCSSCKKPGEEAGAS